MKNRWRADEEVMKRWWRGDEEVMKRWWRGDEELMKNWWRADEEVMKRWWRGDEELMENWWRTVEDYHRLPQTATDWLVLLHCIEHSKLSPGLDGWMDGIHLSLTPPTTRAPLAVLTMWQMVGSAVKLDRGATHWKQPNIYHSRAIQAFLWDITKIHPSWKQFDQRCLVLKHYMGMLLPWGYCHTF